ncbi:MAG: hypothetical protein ACLQU3_20760 [Limisphaerales bacterium]
MNGIRFYHEFTNNSEQQSVGTVVAALVGNGHFWSADKVCYEALSGLFDHPNSVVGGTAVARDYLHDKCKRISEDKARTIHPALFERLDQP